MTEHPYQGEPLLRVTQDLFVSRRTDGWRIWKRFRHGMEPLGYFNLTQHLADFLTDSGVPTTAASLRARYNRVGR